MTTSLRPQTHDLEGLPAPGELVLGKYRIERVVGRGGMGVVLAAHHELLATRVAIKMLLPRYREDASAEQRFLHEGRMAAQVRSEHVAHILDVGKVENLPYIAMEYLEGEDLDDVLERKKQLEVGETVDHVLQAIEGLAHAHKLGIVHRDLKPANLFVAKGADGPTTKLIDFGISKMDAEIPNGDPRLTQTGTLVGSPVYMSPEQIRSAKEVDVRTDIWSLGTVLYELLAGRPPFLCEEAWQVLTAILTQPHNPVRSLRPDVPEKLCEVISRCLRKSPEHRFQNVAELADALVPFGSGTFASCAVRARERLLGRASLASISEVAEVDPGSLAGLSVPSEEIPTLCHEPKPALPEPILSGPPAGTSTPPSRRTLSLRARTLPPPRMLVWGSISVSLAISMGIGAFAIVATKEPRVEPPSEPRPVTQGVPVAQGTPLANPTPRLALVKAPEADVRDVGMPEERSEPPPRAHEPLRKRPVPTVQAKPPPSADPPDLLRSRK